MKEKQKSKYEKFKCFENWFQQADLIQTILEVKKM